MPFTINQKGFLNENLLKMNLKNFWNILKSYIGYLFIMRTTHAISFEQWQQALNTLNFEEMNERLNRNAIFTKQIETGRHNNHFPLWQESWKIWQTSNQIVQQIRGFIVCLEAWNI